MLKLVRQSRLHMTVCRRPSIHSVPVSWPKSVKTCINFRGDVIVTCSANTLSGVITIYPSIVYVTLQMQVFFFNFLTLDRTVVTMCTTSHSVRRVYRCVSLDSH